MLWSALRMFFFHWGASAVGLQTDLYPSTCNQPVMTKSPSYYLPAPALCCSDSVFYAQSPSCSPCLPPAALQRRPPPAAAPLTPAAAAASDTCSARPFARPCRLDGTMAAASIAAYACPCSLSPFCVPPLVPLVPLFLSLEYFFMQPFFRGATGRSLHGSTSPALTRSLHGSAAPAPNHTQ